MQDRFGAAKYPFDCAAVQVNETSEVKVRFVPFRSQWSGSLNRRLASTVVGITITRKPRRSHRNINCNLLSLFAVAMRQKTQICN